MPFNASDSSHISLGAMIQPGNVIRIKKCNLKNGTKKLIVPSAINSAQNQKMYKQKYN